MNPINVPSGPKENVLGRNNKNIQFQENSVVWAVLTASWAYIHNKQNFLLVLNASIEPAGVTVVILGVITGSASTHQAWTTAWLQGSDSMSDGFKAFGLHLGMFCGLRLQL